MKEEKTTKKHRGWVIFKRITGVVLILIFLAVAAAGALVGYLSLREYKPGDIEAVTVEGEGGKTVRFGEEITVLTFNTGYGALDAGEDFFMDGGSGVNADSVEQVNANIAGISGIISEVDADVVFLQEVDRDSNRSKHVDQAEIYAGLEADDSFAYATNFRCDFIPYPIPPIGKVEAGLVTLSKFQTLEAERIALPTTYTWPVRVAQLKRCLLLERIPIHNSDKQLVIVNLHLEAYDDGEAKIAQTQELANVLKSEYEKGNYCIAGGDFNQFLPSVDEDRYPVINEEYFQAKVLDGSLFGSDWNFLADDSVPTARLLNQPYDPSDSSTQYYMLDGFITSPNVSVNLVQTLDEGFEYSDHNPMLLNVTLIGEENIEESEE
ncbi:endonuclease/exonuclease/phosphatase family metal-dependent hydrolase [Catenibacillus scindens]|uniref:Endonuclease/exonuclease/phosphatase family metal-dependent hydrolase n=1 Tax=Catenibacillus scindens TaxID=673271 RepID=A0A7W8H9G7_9FIRM|nr:endonuclease/exonuclease/phosphatase family protein [Catenibacillus scindens]MBB5264361.1 endonuclease/exonuclease/phosphatase family metal-dependent hydrolase [Catenibacillus scindens]